MNRQARLQASRDYLRARLRRRVIAFSLIALLVASVIASHAGAFGRGGDDWAGFDHRTFAVGRVLDGESFEILTGSGRTEVVRLLGVSDPDFAARGWMEQQLNGRQVTLLLQSTGTRDSAGRLLAFAFVGKVDLSVELTRAGLIYADRREKTVMDGLVDPAEAEARKKKRGMWATIQFDQMPAWRKDWLASLPGHRKDRGS